MPMSDEEREAYRRLCEAEQRVRDGGDPEELAQAWRAYRAASGA